MLSTKNLRFPLPATMFALAAGLCVTANVVAQDAKPGTSGRFLTVTSPIDDGMSGRIRNQALDLQQQAINEGRDVILVLEITPGSTSEFGRIRDLAKFLTSSELSRVRTVAWVPATVTGYKVVLALACNEIIMHPDAELGDIGRDTSVADDERQFVLNLISEKHNRRVSPALARGMMDRDVKLTQITVASEDGGNESRVVTGEEHQLLLDGNAVISGTEPIKDAGVPGVFSGRQASAGGYLVEQTRETRRDVADLYQLPVESMREDVTVTDGVGVRLIQVKDTVDPILETFVERQINRAVAGGANIIIFEIDSPGGWMTSGEALANAIADLEDANIRTIAYIPNDALSMAAVIAMSCDEIYMHPDARIGDAELIMEKEAGWDKVPEKVYSPFRARLRSLAKRKGRSEALFVAMNDPNLEVFRATNKETGRVAFMTQAEMDEEPDQWTKGARVQETGDNQLLTVDGERAHELGLTMAPVNDIDELKERVGLPPETKLVPVGRTWVDTLVFILNTDGAMFFLVVFGIAFIYLELHFMSGFLGIMSAVCFGLFFWARFLGGTAGYLELVLFALGIACILMEIFVIPGFGVFGVSGGLLVISSLVLAANTFNADFSTSQNLTRLTPAVGTLVAAFACVIAAAVMLNKFLPSIPFLNRMILTPPGLDDPDSPRLSPEFTLAAETASGVDLSSLVGDHGVAASKLRPAGKAQIGEHFLDVVSDGPFVASGTLVEVVSVQGNKVTVRAIDS
jgi:membrane-bound serine protease (ClpP class)